ncbi:MAG: phosphoribosylanthranilate isomerase [Planctomycetes bacterium]|nr:phosphoribosylanthranilate isomerase [Planctomycetota bacterium]
MSYSCKIKLCGLKTEADVQTAVDLGVDAIGFVLTKSPRQIPAEACANLRRLVPASITVHGVIAPATTEEVTALAEKCPVDLWQIHGHEEEPEFWSALDGLNIMRAFRVRGEETLGLVRSLGLQSFLLDAYVPGVPGGTGETFDWGIALEAGRIGKVVLAGGLDPDNVGDAIRAARPWMVDVSGGIEKSRGIKDHGKMKAFVEAVRSACQEICQ